MDKPRFSGMLSGVKRFVLLLCAFVLAACRYYRLEGQRENPGKADVIIVPGVELSRDGEASWMMWNRVLMGRVLMERGYATRMIVTGGKPRNGHTEASRMVEAAVALGIPEDAVVAEPKATSSVQNGRFSAEIMVEQGWKSALVVSDWQHLRYAIPVFRDAFSARGLELFWYPVDYALMQSLPEARHPEQDPR